MEMSVYVGCYTTPDRKGHGQGITAYDMDPRTGSLKPCGVVAQVVNPSFLAVHPNRRFLYCVHGGNSSEVSAFAIRGNDGQLEPLGSRWSGGVNPVHLDVHPGGRWLVVANYTGASIALLPVGQDGQLGSLTDLVKLTGAPGPDPVEQSGPHPHDIPFDPSGEFVVVPDKGLDSVFIFRVDTAAGRFRAAYPPFVRSASGAGPRHVAFHPTRLIAYVINELNSSISVYAYDRGGTTMQEIQTLASAPANVAVRNTGSEVVVHPSGNFVYVSNRGHDSVGAFAVRRTDGMLNQIDWYPTCGDTPRAIALDPSGQFLYAANQASDSITAFRVDTRTGQLQATDQTVETGSPSTIVFVRGSE